MVDFDPDALRARYRAERDKRLRADALGQYIPVEGEFAHLLDDPYVEPGFTRDPRTDRAEVLMIGGGFGGLLIGARLRQAGIEDLRIVEKGGDFGGTWYWNRYPGVACDVESYVYLPLLEEMGVMPSRKYARGPEIFAHCQAIGRHFDLYRDVLFQTAVTELRWDEAEGHWLVRTDRGDAMRARHVIMANGPLNHPKLPGIAGIETFTGHSFHTSRWDYDYTGGTSAGGLDGLADKVVGIIGTGATAVQAIPHLAAGAKHLYVFQRTPSSIDVRDDRSTDPDWAASLEPGWQRRRIENFGILTSGGTADEDMVQDGWTDVAGNVRVLTAQMLAAGEPPEEVAKIGQLADFSKMEGLRARVDAVVSDPDTAAALKPYYNQFCKRPCFHDEYLPAFNRPNVTLVDTDGKGVDRIAPAGVIAGGHEYALDCLVWATGFEVGIGFDKRVGYPIYGVGGVALTEKWRRGASTLHGLMSNGFPNCFVVSHIQSGFAINFVEMLDVQARHIAYILGRAEREGIARIEVTQAAEQGWVDEILRTAIERQAFLEECTPGYYNYEGDVKAMSIRNGAYGAGPAAYAKVLAGWREQGDMAGLTLTPFPATAN